MRTAVNPCADMVLSFAESARGEDVRGLRTLGQSISVLFLSLNGFVGLRSIHWTLTHPASRHFSRQVDCTVTAAVHAAASSEAAPVTHM